MTLGEKIKQARTENGFTQEELAEKLMVSRQAITKWESDKGIPDISNLRMLARCFNVSIDYLLDDGENVDMSVVRESIDISRYSKALIKKKLTDQLMREKFPKAQIHTLIAKKKMDKVEKMVETFLFLTTPFANVIEFLNSLKLIGTEYYLVNDDDRQFFVSVNYKEGYMEIRRLVEFRHLRQGDKFSIGDLTFMDCGEIK